MRDCLEQVEAYALQYGYRVALPGFLGCGIAGGNWNTVHHIIGEVFGASPVPLTIVYRANDKIQNQDEPGDINVKLQGLTPEQANQLGAHLNAVYIRAEKDREKKG